jgi:hypothetical protein
MVDRAVLGELLQALEAQAAPREGRVVSVAERAAAVEPTLFVDDHSGVDDIYRTVELVRLLELPTDSKAINGTNK